MCIYGLPFHCTSTEKKHLRWLEFQRIFPWCSNRSGVMGILMVGVQTEHLLILDHKSENFRLVSCKSFIEKQNNFKVCRKSYHSNSSIKLPNWILKTSSFISLCWKTCRCLSSTNAVMSGFLLERLFSQGFSITFSSGSTTACVKTSNILPSPSIACLVPRNIWNWNYKIVEQYFYIARYQNFLFLHREDFQWQ